MLTQSDLIFNEELAAWVQAVGSVVAIFVAIAIPLYLNYLEKKNTRKLLETQKQKYFVILFPSLYRIRRYSQDFLNQMSLHEHNTENILHTLDSSYLDLIPVFSNELHIFVHSQIYDEDLNQLAFEFFFCEEVLHQHLNQPIHQKKKEHQDQIVFHAKKANELCAKLIEKNEKSYLDADVNHNKI